jgi:hypothetical protein
VEQCVGKRHLATLSRLHGDVDEGNGTSHFLHPRPNARSHGVNIALVRLRHHVARPRRNHFRPQLRKLLAQLQMRNDEPGELEELAPL